MIRWVNSRRSPPDRPGDPPGRALAQPSLPEELDGLDFEVRYRGHWGINLHLTSQLLRIGVAASDAAPIRVGVGGQVIELPPGSMREFPL